jgi:hypothetical protein
MLTTNISSVPPVENNIDFTLDDFLQFYRSVASQSFQKASPHYSALTLMRDRLFRYISSLTAEDAAAINFTAIHRKMLVEQIATLLEKDMMTIPLNSQKLGALIQDISRNGERLKKITTSSEKDALLSCLTTINEECQAAEPIADTVPAQLKTGVSSTEQNVIAQGVNHYTSLPAVTLNRQGLEKLHHHEWLSAVEYFQQAVAAEHQIATECHQSPNMNNIATYDRNMANAYYLQGMSLQHSQQYPDAIVIYNKALVASKAIPTDFYSTEDKGFSIGCHRDISLCENYFANLLLDTNQVTDAIQHYKLAINELDKIASAFHSDNDTESVSIYKRNLAFACNKKGDEFYEQKAYTEAITYYEFAQQAIAEVDPEHRQAYDAADECLYQINKEMAKLNKTISMAMNRNAFFRPIDPAPDEMDQEPPLKKRRLH